MLSDWYVEAFRNDTEFLAWHLLLSDLEKEDLERTLNISLPTADTYSISVEQVLAAVKASSADVSPDDLDLDTERLSFFLTLIRRDAHWYRQDP